MPLRFLRRGIFYRFADFFPDLSFLSFVVTSCAVPMGEAITREAGNDVEVGVENDLASWSVVVHFNIDAIGIKRAFNRN